MKRIILSLMALCALLPSVANAMESNNTAKPVAQEPTSQNRELSLWVQPAIAIPPSAPRANSNEIARLLQEVRELPHAVAFIGNLDDWIELQNLIAQLDRPQTQVFLDPFIFPHNNTDWEQHSETDFAQNYENWRPQYIDDTSSDFDPELDENAAIDTARQQETINQAPANLAAMNVVQLLDIRLRRTTPARPRAQPSQFTRQYTHKQIKEDEQCGICLEAFDGEQVWVCIDPCDHHYHRACIQQWQKEPRSAAKNCPHCREKINKLINQEEQE